MPKLAVIGGSGAHELLKKKLLGKSKRVQPKKTPFGKVTEIFAFETDGIEVCFLPRHGSTGYKTAAPFVNYRANIWALKSMGVERIVSWSGPGVINPEFDVGRFAVPHDLIDQTRSRPATFFEKGGLGFIRMSSPFCPDLRHALFFSMQNMGIKSYEEAVYVCTEGPRLETPAEIRLYHSYGADLVGMTLIPETFLARELEMCYSAICYLTNFAEGIAERDFKQGVLFEGMMTDDEKEAVDNAMDRMPEIIIGALKAASDHPRECACKDAMLRYKKRGDIGGDWKKWIDP